MIIESLNKVDQQIIQQYGWPKELVSQLEKNSEDWTKLTMDYFSTVAFAQYKRNEGYRKDFKLANGEFDFKDYQEDNDYQAIADFLNDSPQTDSDTPSHLAHYSIVNQPINTLLGEFIKRPYKVRVEALDEISLKEKIDFRSELLIKHAMEKVKAKVAGMPEEEAAKVTEEEMSSQILNYTTLAEKWGNKMLEAMRSQLNFKHKSSKAFKDFLICGRQFHHFCPDTSRLGFTYRVENPSNVWFLANRNAETTKDCWAVGTIDVLTLGEIIERYELPGEEVEYLNDYGHSSMRNNEYSPFSPTMPALNDPLYNLDMSNTGDFSTNGISPNIYAYNSQYRYTVVKAYFLTRKKLYKRTYLDPDGNKYSDIQSEDYKLCKECGDVKLEKFYVNQWYEGLKIGMSIYHMKPLEFCQSAPIVGIVNTTRNTQGKSILQFLKPFQIMYNICINNIKELLEIEIGTPILMDARVIPNIDHADPLDHMLEVAKKKGVLMIDTSIENTGGNLQFNQFTKLDATQSEQLKSRINIAQIMKEEAWELVGISRQRLGSVLATESATGTNTAMSQSFAQTEPWFMMHDYILTEVYQTLLDIVQYITLKKPESILSYLNDDLENELLEITQDELLRDLFVKVRSFSEDRDLLDTIRELAQPAMQNGAELSEIADLLTANSQRSFRDTLTKIEKRKAAQLEQQNQMQQAELQQRQQQFEQQIQYQEQVRQEENERDDNNLQLDRELKIQLEVLKGIANESSFNPDVDLTGQLIEQAKLAKETSQSEFDKQIKKKEMAQKDKELEIKEKDVDQKLKIAQYRDKGKLKK